MSSLTDSWVTGLNLVKMMNLLIHLPGGLMVVSPDDTKQTILYGKPCIRLRRGKLYVMNECIFLATGIYTKYYGGNVKHSVNAIFLNTCSLLFHFYSGEVLQ